MTEAEQTVMNIVRGLLRRRNADLSVEMDSELHGELGLDSLDIAEFSAALEDDLGSDPYSAGQTPRTVGEVIGFYEAKPANG